MADDICEGKRTASLYQLGECHPKLSRTDLYSLLLSCSSFRAFSGHILLREEKIVSIYSVFHTPDRLNGHNTSNCPIITADRSNLWLCDRFSFEICCWKNIKNWGRQIRHHPGCVFRVVEGFLWKRMKCADTTHVLAISECHVDTAGVKNSFNTPPLGKTKVICTLLVFVHRQSQLMNGGQWTT